MRTRLLKLVRGGAGVALLASGMGVVGALGVSAATSGVASAATTTGLYHCATPLGNKSIPVKVTTLSNTTPKTVQRTHTFSAKPKLTATIPASLIKTAHTADPTLTSLAASAATLDVVKHNFSGPAFVPATKKATITTNVALALINTTTIHHGAVITVTYTAVTFTVTSNTGKATITPGTLDLFVLVPLTCYPPSKVITYNTPTTVTKGYTVTGTNTLGVITTVNATAKHTPLSLTPPSGALPNGQATVHYSEPNYFTAVTGQGTNVWTETGTLDGLVFSHTGTHASIAGTPSGAGTFPFKVKVATKTGTSVTHTYTLLVTAAPATPVILQPFQLTVTGGSLTMTCGKGRGTAVTAPASSPTTASLGAATKLPVETQSLAKTCTLITLGSVKLNEKNQPVSTRMHTLFISTARGGPTDDWTLNAVMVPTKTSLTHNAYCNTVQGFCNVITTNPAKLATIHTYQNTTILPNYLYLHGYTCKPQRTLSTLTLAQYYNVNPTPTTTPGRNIGTGHNYGLSTTMTLCTAAAGVSGGEFIVKTGIFTLVVPPNIYAGTYYGTVQYTLVASI